jgi:hypothetical protein
MGTVESEMNSLIKTVAGVEKVNGQGLNKVDDLVKRLGDIQKRLTKLEGHKN